MVSSSKISGRRLGKHSGGDYPLHRHIKNGAKKQVTRQLRRKLKRHTSEDA